MTDRELMQQALDALEGYARNCRCEGGGAPCDAAEALRARLAGWEKLNMNDHKEGDLGIGAVKWDASAPLVMHPHPAFQATQPQPDLAKVGEVGVWGEKEPVAWTTDLEFDQDTEVIPAKEKGKLGTDMMDIPLYTAPPQREERNT